MPLAGRKFSTVVCQGARIPRPSPLGSPTLPSAAPHPRGTDDACRGLLGAAFSNLALSIRRALKSNHSQVSKARYLSKRGLSRTYTLCKTSPTTPLFRFPTPAREGRAQSHTMATRRLVSQEKTALEQEDRILSGAPSATEASSTAPAVPM